MTRTIRIYNKHPLRLGPGYCGWIVSNKIPERDYHPWQQWGRMRGWKDWRLRSRRRQENKIILRELWKMYAPYGIPDVYDMSYRCEYEYYVESRQDF